MCSSLASEKGYGTGWAAFLGFVFGLFALIYYAGLPLSEEKRRAEYSVVASAVSAAMARTAAQPSAPAQAAPDRSTPAVQPFAGPPEARSARTIDALKALDAETSSSRKLPVAGKADAIVCSACGQEQPSSAGYAINAARGLKPERSRNKPRNYANHVKSCSFH